MLLFNLIKTEVEKSHSKNAYIYYSSNGTKQRKYKQIQMESQEFKKFISKIPKHVCVGLYMKNNPCIPMIIYSLLECEISFIFLDPKSSLDINKELINDLDLYAVIVCSEVYALELVKFSIFRDSSKYSTEFGCTLIMFKSRDVESSLHNYKDICYVMRTSGTVGEQKYVKVTNDCITSNIISLNKKFQLTNLDVIYFGTPLTFDPCLVELFLGLITGATLIATSLQIRNEPNILFQTLFPKNSMHSVTFLQMCPSVFLRWTDDDINELFNNSTLKILALGGEPFPENILELKRSIDLRIFNLYGITEVSCWASICEIKKEVTLGNLLEDTSFKVIDNKGNEISSGEGTLLIGSIKRICLMGKETLDKIQTPLYRDSGDIVHIEDNVLKYLGRSNRTIKRFGHRINLDILEKNIYASINLFNKCIWHLSIQKLTTFVLIKHCNDKEKILDKIRVKLLKDIESPYFPDHIDIISEYPITINGKLDIASLEILGMKHFNAGKSQSSISEAFKVLWKKYFGITTEANRSCNFYEMGGTSILRIQFIEELKNSCTRSPTSAELNLLFESSFEYSCKHLLSYNDNETNQEFLTKSVYESNILKFSWKFDLHMCVDTPATIIDREKKYVAIGNFSNKFVVLNAVDGKEISHTWLPNNIENSCCVSPDLSDVYVGCFDGFMYCLDIDTCKVKWSFPTNGRIKNTGCFSTDKSALIFGSYDNFVYSIDTANGKLIWKQCLEEPITATLVNVDGRIFVGSIKCTISCLNELNGDILWTYKTKNPIFASPQKTAEFIMFSDVLGFIYCFNHENGHLQWIYQPERNSHMYSSFLIHNNLIFLGLQEKMLCVLEFSDSGCFLIYSLETNYKVLSRPQILYKGNSTYLLFVTMEGVILLYQYVSNELVLIESAILGNQCFSAPIVCDNKLFVGLRDNYLYCIDIKI